MHSDWTGLLAQTEGMVEGTVAQQEGTLLFANPAAARILGYADSSEILALGTIDRMIDPRDLPGLPESAVNGSFETEGRHVVARGLRKDGAVIQLDVFARFVEWNTIPIQVLTFAATGRRAAPSLDTSQEADLIHRARLLDLGRVATGLIHELSQPLTAAWNLVAACKNTIERDHTATDQVLAMLKRADGQIQRGCEIIQRTRDFIRKAPPKREATDVGVIINEIAQAIAFEATRRGVDVRVRLATGLPKVDVDPIQIQQVVLNLVMNGVEAMDEAAGKDRALVIRAARMGDAIRISIEDRGPGITEEFRHHQVEPFFTTKESGLGVGLAVCRRILSAHSSQLVLEPRHPSGLVASFDLPVAPRSDDTPADCSKPAFRPTTL